MFQAKRLVVYLVRANKEGTIQTLMGELQVGKQSCTQAVVHGNSFQ